MNIDVVGITRAFPRTSHFLRRVRTALTGRPYYLNRMIIKGRVFEEINRRIPFENYLETGTYLGLTTYFFGKTAKARNAQVYASEISKDFLEITRHAAGHFPNMHFILGNSVDFLRELKPKLSQATNFIYLDAHWYDYLPLRDELEILRDWRNSIIMIDDFKVPNNPDFGWDKYDEGRELTLEYIAGSFGDHPVFFPNYPVKDEGGPILGYCVIPTSRELELELTKIPYLEKHRPAG